MAQSARTRSAATEAAPTPADVLTVASTCRRVLHLERNLRAGLEAGDLTLGDYLTRCAEARHGLPELLDAFARSLKRDRPELAARCPTLLSRPVDLGGVAKELEAVVESIRKRAITAAVAESRYHVTASTLSRRARAGDIADLRPPGAPSNAPLLVDEWEIAGEYAKKI